MGLEMDNEELETKTELKKKPTKKTKEMLEENSKQIEELKDEQVKLNEILAELDKEEEAIGSRSALKMKVTHKKFGNGQVVHASSPKTGIKISNYNYRAPAKMISLLP